MLTNDEVESVHHASLDILQNVGIHVTLKEAQDMFAKNGAIVDYEKNIAKFPPDVVMDYVRKAPTEFALYSRNSKFDMFLTPGNAYFGFGPGPTRFLDIDTGRAREATLNDLDKLIRLADSLENFSFISELVYPTDVPPAVTTQYIWASAFKNSSKHMQMYIEGADYVRDGIAMASAVSGSEEALAKKPIIDFLGCVGQPLTYETKLITGFMEAAKHKIPVYVQSGAMAGATGPATLAGTLALCNAEILSGIVVLQMTNPGTPVVYMNWARIFDMKSANVTFNSPEFVKLRIAVGQLVRRCYHIPFASPGFQVDSKMLDVQAGYEKYVTLISMLAGANVMLGETVSGANHTDPLGWIIDDELAANYKQIMKGFPVNNETLALDVVRSVGTGPGRNFLGTKHTHEHFRENQWLDYTISDRRSDTIWEKDGAKDAKQRARKKLEERLTHQPEQLPNDVQKELDRIVSDARKRHA